MKGFLSIVLDENNKYKHLSLSTLTDEIKFDSGDIQVDWYFYIKHRIDTMLLEVQEHKSIFEFLQENKKYEIKYFSVDKEDFLTKEEYLETSYLDKKSLMGVLVNKKLKTFHEYKEYIITTGLSIKKDTSESEVKINE